MKISSLVSGFTVLLLSLTGCHVEISGPAHSTATDWPVESEVTHSGVISAQVTILEVENRYGSVRITGSDSNQGEWSQTLKIRAADDAEARLIAQGAAASVTGDTHLKLMVAPPQSNQRGSFSSDLEITVPRNMIVRARNHYGLLAVSGINTNVEAANQSGTIDLSEINGSVRAQSSYASLKVHAVGAANLKNQSGSIEATDVRGNLEANTSYASLKARDVSGAVKLINQSGGIEAENVGDAEVTTSYAAMRLRNASGNARLINQSGRVEAEAVAGDVFARTSYATLEVSGSGPSFVCENQSGNVRVCATSETLKKLQAKTSYARLEVQLPAQMKPAIQARTSYAEVESDFPILMNRKPDPFKGIPAETPLVQLQNQSGKITITGK